MSRNLYDILIVGGGFSGPLMAITLLRKNPKLKIILVDKGDGQEQRVGESTSDITAIFLNSFGIDEILERQTMKTGLRFVFESGDEFLSPSQKSIANGYQLDRKRFDRDLLSLAKDLGADVFQEARVDEFHRIEDFKFTAVLEKNSDKINIETRWIVDASGRNRFLNKRCSWKEESLSFNTASSWAHFRGVDLNGLQCSHQKWDSVGIGESSRATTHLLGKGYWAWVFPIDNDLVSIGVVYEKSFFDKSVPKEIFEQILKNNSILSNVTKEASYDKMYHRDQLPYLSKKVFEKGLLAIGDSVGFIDPLFSPGLELSTQFVGTYSRLLLDFFDSNSFNLKKWKKAERRFLYAIKVRIKTYQDRYKILHHFELFTNWVQLDFFGYFAFFAIPAALFPRKLLARPVDINKLGYIFYKIYVKRILEIGKRKDRLSNGFQASRKEFVYSEAKVPVNFFSYLSTSLKLLYMWVKHYLLLECRKPRS